ncbi:MAG: hypothetical protein J6U98_02765, partial [Abditibacteriota bacterium]|nr:hypothetical protein [Abditibacteriota bacterium]
MENTKDSENGKVLYKCSNRSAGPWIRSGDPDGYTIIVYENGCVEYIHHRFEEGVALAHRWEEVDGKFESVWYPAYEPVWKKIIAENKDI